VAWVGLSLGLMTAPLGAQGLSPAEQRLVAAVDAGHEAAVVRLARAVDIPSATENHAGVRRVGDLYAAELAAMGFPEIRCEMTVATPVANVRAFLAAAREHAGV
jgi:hypothetical protein